MSFPVDECELPSDWSVSSVSEVATFSRGVSWRKVEEVPEGEGLQVVSIPNIKDGWIDYKSKFNHYLSKEVSAAKRLNVGDIVFVGSSGSVHNVGRNARISSLPNGSVAFASFTFKAAPKPDKIDEDFLYFLVNSEMVPFPDFCKRAADGKFNFQLRDFASRLRIPLPPLLEQKKIAVLSSQRPSELSQTVLSQCNTFLLHRISNDRDQEIVHRLVPDNLKGLLRELPSLPSQNAILLGWASELPVLVRMNDLPSRYRPQSDDPDYWDVWTGVDKDGNVVERNANWKSIVDDWQNSGASEGVDSEEEDDSN